MIHAVRTGPGALSNSVPDINKAAPAAGIHLTTQVIEQGNAQEPGVRGDVRQSGTIVIVNDALIALVAGIGH